jgi:predicted dehydrogenase
MPIRVAALSAAHVHAPSFIRCFMDHPDAELVGVWDEDQERGQTFAKERNLDFQADPQELLKNADAVVICSENLRHADHIEMAAKAGKAILCEKPIAASRDQLNRIEKTIADTNVPFMTAFPCPFSPAFQRMKQRLGSGEIGKVLALATTNRGSCPWGWFTETDKSGGGAMIDHVVHVTDLLRRLLNEDPQSVYAQIGSNMYGQAWDDTAVVTISFPSGVFATLDSSWSRTPNYWTWGDVTLKATGEKGIVESDLFGMGIEVYTTEPPTRRTLGLGADFDALMVAEFLASLAQSRSPLTTLQDGLWSSRVALAAYDSVKSKKAEKV